VGFHGTGTVTYREALAAVFMEGYVAQPFRGCEKVIQAFEQMDFRRFIPTRSSSMARSYHATVPRPRCRSWYRPFHRVICLPSFFSFLIAQSTFSFIGLCMHLFCMYIVTTTHSSCSFWRSWGYWWQYQHFSQPRRMHGRPLSRQPPWLL
jgi:hypothetical protein